MTPLRGLNPDFRDLLVCLGQEGVEYVLVGAYALAFHGIPRATGDIDVFVRATPANGERTWRALRAFGAPLSGAGVEPRDFAAPDVVYQIGLPPRRVDVLTSISGVSFDEAWESRETADLDGTPVHFHLGGGLRVNVLDLGVLGEMKQALGRERDRSRLPEYRRTLEERRKRERGWLGRSGVSALRIRTISPDPR